MNKILYKLTDGKPSFWLMRDVPEEPGYCLDHAVCEHGCHCDQTNDYYKSKLNQCKANAIEIINPELLNPNMSALEFSKDGDIFPFPDSLEFEEEDYYDEDVDDPAPYAEFRRVIRLAPKQKEETQDELWQTINPNKPRYIASTNLHTAGMQKEWIELWEQVEIWYGDPKKLETCEQLITRLKSKFTISRKP